ncbi:MAG: DUF2452 domain-containing protein [Chitinophagaceae bacterium]
MVQAYNFLASWQLFPEKGTYEYGNRPKSGIYRIGITDNKQQLAVSMNWVTLENQAFSSEYSVVADANEHPFDNTELANTITAVFADSITFELIFYDNGQQVLSVLNELMPNGYLKKTQRGFTVEQQAYCNIEYFYKQMSVLPYASSASGALIKPTEGGIIRHKALSAMEEQTNMQLDQIRRQIELLALQAQEIQARKELSAIIYDAKLGFQPVIGQVYYLYEKKDDAHLVSMISPKEWGGGAGPYKKFLAAVKLLADHTWQEVQ